MGLGQFWSWLANSARNTQVFWNRRVRLIEKKNLKFRLNSNQTYQPGIPSYHDQESDLRSYNSLRPDITLIYLHPNRTYDPSVTCAVAKWSNHSLTHSITHPFTPSNNILWHTYCHNDSHKMTATQAWCEGLIPRCCAKVGVFQARRNIIIQPKGFRVRDHQLLEHVTCSFDGSSHLTSLPRQFDGIGLARDWFVGVCRMAWDNFH